MKRIFLSEKSKKLGGVLAGIGETYDIDPTLLRILTILLAVLSGFFPVLIAYFIVWLIVPHEPHTIVEKKQSI